jgi:hypothetical protein
MILKETDWYFIAYFESESHNSFNEFIEYYSF